MTSVQIPSELAPYLDQLIDVLQRNAPVEAVYLSGSAALGAYEHGRSETGRRVSKREAGEWRP